MIKIGDKIRIIRMSGSGGLDWVAAEMSGKVVTVRYIDDAGQIHLEETGLALIPEVDKYEVLW